MFNFISAGSFRPTSVLARSCFLFGSLIVLGLFSSYSFVSAKDKTEALSPSLCEHLEKDKFKKIASIEKLPNAVREFYEKRSNCKIARIFAEPGQDWAAGCVRTPAGPPARSFIVGAASPVLCLLYYETGGFALVDSVDMFRLQGRKAELIWSRSMFRDHPKNMDDLLQSVRTRVKQESAG